MEFYLSYALKWWKRTGFIHQNVPNFESFPPKQGKSWRKSHYFLLFPMFFCLSTCFHMCFLPTFPHNVETVDCANKPYFIGYFDVDYLSTMLWKSTFFPLFHFLHLSTVEFPPVFHVDKCVKIKYTLKIACFQPIFLWKTIFYLSVIEFFHTL